MHKCLYKVVSSMSRELIKTTVELPNNGQVGDECFVHGSEVVCVWTIIQAGGEQFVHCREAVHSGVSIIGGSLYRLLRSCVVYCMPPGSLVWYDCNKL